jgi:lambda family phage portal protein
VIEVRPTVMDRMVAAFSPRRGLQRIAARASFQAMAAASAPTEPGGGRVFGRGGYKGAHGDRRQTRGWFARLRSANQDALGNQRTLIARARDAAMNMPLATAAVERPITFTVGTGLMAIPDLKPELLGISEADALALASQIAADFDNYMASTDPDAERTATGYDMQEIVLRGVLESGDIGALRVMPEEQASRLHETAWKLIEADRIVSPAGHRDGERWGGETARRAPRPGERVPPAGPTGNVIVGGIEQDEWGAPIAVHILKKAPDSYGAAARSARTEGDTVRIPVWGSKSGLPSVVHVMAKRRPEQSRGVSILAPVIEVLKQVSDLTEAELFAAVLTSMLAVIYKSPGAQAMPEPDYGEEGSASAAQGLDRADRPFGNYRLEPGTILEIDSEAGAEMKSPGRPNPAFDPFFVALAKQIAAAIEVPFEVLMLSFTASYSASRGALEVFYLTVRKRRGWLASHWCTPVYRAWLFEQVAKGIYRMPGFFDSPLLRERWSNVRFRGDGKISLDPAREAKALEVQEAHCWSTGAEITAELNGGDYDANVRRRAGEHKRFVDAGLPVPNAKGGGTEPASEHRERRASGEEE